MSISDLMKVNNREETVTILRRLHEKGYRYVVRDRDMTYLTCFSLKPKRYQDTESWGYVISDLGRAMPAYPIKNTDITEINYFNRSATLISDFKGG